MQGNLWGVGAAVVVGAVVAGGAELCCTLEILHGMLLCNVIFFLVGRTSNVLI
jgi:hypothetical protein